MLEPRQEEVGKVIFKSILEVDEMFFIMKGTIDVGYELDRAPKYCLRLKQRNVIGAYNCTFN